MKVLACVLLAVACQAAPAPEADPALLYAGYPYAGVYGHYVLLLSPVTLYRLLLEDIKLLLALMETLLDLSMSFPVSSLPLPLPIKSPVEM